jgi:hypothetical protein
MEIARKCERKNYSTVVCHRQALMHRFWYSDGTPPVLAVLLNTAEEIQSIFAEMQREHFDRLTDFQEALAHC